MRFGQRFPAGVDVDVYYAGKAFLSIAVARWAHEEGLRIDTASMGEMAVALRAGIPGDHMGLHGNNKSDEERRRAITHRVGRIVIDSPGEIDDIVRVARALGRTAADPVPVMVRVTTGIHAGGHDFIATAREDQKFGLSLAGGQALATLTAVLDHPELHLLGAHAHIGSQIQDPTAFEVNARKMLTLRADLEHATGYLMPELDLGGGYGIAYTPEETPIDVPNLAQRLATTLSEVAAELGTTIPRISIEPGRSIIGPAMVTCYRVGVVKPVVTDEGVTRLYVSVDGECLTTFAPRSTAPSTRPVSRTAPEVSKVPLPAWSGNTVNPGTSSSLMLSFPPTLGPEISSSLRQQAPTTGPWLRTTTTSSSRR